MDKLELKNKLLEQINNKNASHLLRDAARDAIKKQTQSDLNTRARTY